jgi:hypothetical protein
MLKVGGRPTKLNLFRGPISLQIHQKTLYYKQFIGQLLNIIIRASTKLCRRSVAESVLTC